MTQEVQPEFFGVWVEVWAPGLGRKNACFWGRFWAGLRKGSGPSSKEVLKGRFQKRSLIISKKVANNGMLMNFGFNIWLSLFFFFFNKYNLFDLGGFEC